MRKTYPLPEPTAELRQIAIYAASMLNAYMLAGFTREEAFELIRILMSNANPRGGQ